MWGTCGAPWPGKGTGGMTDGFPMSWYWEHEQSAWPPWQYTWQTTFITALVTGHHHPPSPVFKIQVFNYDRGEPAVSYK